MAERTTCGTCEHLREPPDSYTAPARCAMDASLDVLVASIQHPSCPLRPRCPPLGITVQAPWGALIAFGGKNVENRNRSTAVPLRHYRGRIALTASAGHTLAARRLPVWQKLGDGRRVHPAVRADIERTVAQCAPLICKSLLDRGVANPPIMNMSTSDIASLAGHWFATARVVEVLAPEQNLGPWAVPGEYGIVLADIAVLGEPEPATGAIGVFRFGRCIHCGRARAESSRHRCPGGGQ